MTAQMNDGFRLRGQQYSLAGISEGRLFDPSAFDLKPIAVCSACWRGYCAEFGLDGSRLVLDALHVGLHPRDSMEANGPVINGVHPQGPNSKRAFFNNFYEGLRIPIEYTGGLLLGDDFIKDLYVHMGFHPAWKYRRVVELIFTNGVLTDEFDRSDQMAQFRTQYLEQRLIVGEQGMPDSEEIATFIERAFDRRY